MQSRITQSALAALLSLGLATAPVLAQDEAAAHSGFWADLGIGAGAGSFTCGGGFSCPEEGTMPSGHFAFGGTLTPQLQLGLGVHAWVNSVEAGAVTTNDIVGFVTLDAYFYLSGSLYLHAAGGLSGYQRSKSNNDNTVESLGPGLMVGAGLDFGAFGIYGNYMLGPDQQPKLNGDAGVDGHSLNFNVVQFGVAFSSR